jgi:hypothetical protein
MKLSEMLKCMYLMVIAKDSKFYYGTLAIVFY